MSARTGLLPDASRTLSGRPDSVPYRQVGQPPATLMSGKIQGRLIYRSCCELVSRAQWLMFPVRGGRLQNAEFVSVRVSEYVPAPARFGYRRGGQLPRSQRDDTLDLGIEIGSAQIQVQPILRTLGFGHALQEDLDALAADGNKALIGTAGRAGAVIPKHAGPEPRCAVQVAAVDDENEVTEYVGLRAMAHCFILTARW